MPPSHSMSLLASSRSALHVISFDDLAASGNQVALPAGYQGIKWESYDPMAQSVTAAPVEAFRGARAVVSGEYALKGLGFQISMADGRRFDLDSLVLANDFCGGGPDTCSNNTIVFTAYRAGAQVGSLEISTALIGQGPALIPLGVFQGIDLFRVESSAIEVFSVDNIALSSLRSPSAPVLSGAGLAALQSASERARAC